MELPGFKSDTAAWVDGLRGIENCGVLSWELVAVSHTGGERLVRYYNTGWSSIFPRP